MSRALFRSSHGVSTLHPRRSRQKDKQSSEPCISKDANRRGTLVSINLPSRPYAIRPLDLLNNDRSSLSIEQWCLLSNVINSFNAKSQISNVRQTITTHVASPPKVRMKTALNSLQNIFNFILQPILPFIQGIPHFSTMPLNDCKILLERNMEILIVSKANFTYRQTDLYSDSAYRMAAEGCCGTPMMDERFKLVAQFETDETLFNLFFTVLCFSTSFYIPKLSMNKSEYSD
ncbi:unnamed protein product [Rotaria sp. Silwood2]|nr:unnamed protein product [Rotaria sp. Silwood2]CAF4043111.1 unnamed protein product [Rotaria sp. Silwood2]